jgi:uncharacterized SAM-binding protein YcdF (DUF218 family)
MTLAVLLIMTGVAAILAVRGFQRSSRLLYCLAIATFVLVGSGVPANWLLRALQDGSAVNTADWGARNAIVLLGAGSELTDRGPELPVFSYGRLTKTFELYRECKARAAVCRIVSSGGDTHGYGRSEAELYTAMLERLGAAPADLIVEKRSLNTWQNAQFTAALLKAEMPDRVLLVSSGIHLRRAELYFTHFGIHAGAVRGDYVRAQLSVVPSAWNILLLDQALHEYLGVLRYHVYNRLGWNTGPARPGAP